MSTDESPPPFHVLIIGAGIVGLALAQSLRKSDIQCTVYERDESLENRAEGWGMSIHRACDALKECLPDSLHPSIASAFVDPVFGDAVNDEFPFVNGKTLATVFRASFDTARHWRVNRDRLTKVLLTGLDVKWGKKLQNICYGDKSVTAVFADGTEAAGSMLVGADGANSTTRKILLPETHLPKTLPVQLMGTTITIPKEMLEICRIIDPIMFRATHPKSGDSLWYSVNGSNPDHTANVELCLTWNTETSSHGPPKATASERIKDFKWRIGVFAAPLQKLVSYIPSDAAMQVVKLSEWAPQKLPSTSGKVALSGDAAHQMTMSDTKSPLTVLGENGNQGIFDALNLSKALQAVARGEKTLGEAVEVYEEEMVQRTRELVRRSTEVTMLSHDWEGIEKYLEKEERKKRVVQFAQDAS